jgi:hypothetical protein
MAALGSVALSTGVAQGHVAHERLPGSAGELTSGLATPIGSAINQATGHIYVGNYESPSVVEFNEEGAVEHTITAGKVAFGIGRKSPAVDNDLASASTGDLYVPDPANSIVDKFTSAGAFICQLNTTGEASCPLNTVAPAAFAGPEAVAVDPSNGDLYVDDSGNGVIDVFSPSGVYLNHITASNSLPLHASIAIAVDSHGNVYASTEGLSVTFATVKFTPSSETVTGATTWVESEWEAINFTTAIATDAAGNVYVSNYAGSSTLVTERSATGEPISMFGGEVAVGDGLSVNNTKHNIYFSEGPSSKVFVYNTFNAATVATGPASEVALTSAKVEGTVNPEGLTITKCFFAYAASKTKPCNLSGAEIGTGNAPVTVTAQLEGLEPGTKYPYKLVVEVESREDKGSVAEFATKTQQPGISGEIASHIERHSARLEGAVNPDNGETAYYFEYATAQKYKETGGAYDGLTATNRIPVEAGASPIPVMPASLSELEPGTEYHYRLVATNTAGTTHGSDATFKTKAPLLPSVIPLPSPNEAKGIEVTSPTSAALRFQVMLNGLSATYTLETGSEVDTAGRPIYSTPTFGAVPEDGALSFSLTNLLPSTVYHVRVVVHNEDGTFTGEDHTFATPGFPAVILTPPPVQIIPTPAEPKPPRRSAAEIRAEMYKHAVALCKKKPKKKRAACLRQAKRRFGPVVKRK